MTRRPGLPFLKLSPSAPSPRYTLHRILNLSWYPVECRFEGKLGCWKGKLLSYGDRLVLLILFNQSTYVYTIISRYYRKGYENGSTSRDDVFF
jgi:hypothetical protein